MKTVKYVIIVVAIIVVASLRIWRRRRRRALVTEQTHAARVPRQGFVKGDVGLVMSRELRERIRGRFYLFGTAIILLVIAAAIVIPVVHRSKAQSETIGVVGVLPATTKSSVVALGHDYGAKVRFVTESNLADAKSNVAAGSIDFALVDGRELVVNTRFSASDTSKTANVVNAIATQLGDERALAAAHLSVQQAGILARAGPLPTVALHHGATKGVNATSLIGVILIFIMLSQYNTWLLVGVMEEKSSRVIEVLLAAVRPVKLLSGKVLGIGLAALLQASVVVAFALILSKAVGSNLLHGTGPQEIIATLVWLVLGYALYCWLYAAAGSMAERQDQVQSLALPLSLPLIVGYVVSLTAASSGSPSLLLKIFAFIPFTAPFAMTVLVGFGAVIWWQFATSVAITLVTIYGVARFATAIYRRAILKTGSRVRLRDFRNS
ncbi:MAG TPA: ABC transporter permease [Acidimicrobiales bacterium]